MTAAPTAEYVQTREVSIGSIGLEGTLAGAALARVRAPTLLIVGGSDETVLQLNRAALAELHCAKDLAVVPGATHLFEEPGALETVVRLAGNWFTAHLTKAAA